MLDTHRFGALVCMIVVSIALTLSFVVRAHTPAPLGAPQPALVATVPGRPVPEVYAVLPLTGQVRGAAATTMPTPADDAGSAKVADTANLQEDVPPVVGVKSEPVVPSVSTREASVRSVTSVPTKATPLEDTVAFRTMLARRIHELTNVERAKHDLPALAYEDVLANNAARYSARMQAENFLDHIDPDGCNMTCRFAADAYVARYWGENLARWRSSYAPSLDELATYFVREWVKSSGHRDNLLSPNFTHEGIGVAVDGNEVYVTVHFAEPM